MKTSWKAVATYYFLACLWSWPFFWMRDMNSEVWKALQIPNFLKNWSYMWGPGVAAIICFFIFKNHQRKTTFQGTSFYFGIAMVSLLPILLAIQNLDIRYLGSIGVLGFISILGEELGWRGFLQDALKFDSDVKKAIFIGVLWEIWHFTNRTTHRTFFSAVFMVSMWSVVTTALSYIILKLTKRTQSLLVAVTVHMAFDAVFEFEKAWIVILICLPIWAVLIWKWPKSRDTFGPIEVASG